jgi:primary-amine oxidase
MLMPRRAYDTGIRGGHGSVMRPFRLAAKFALGLWLGLATSVSVLAEVAHPLDPLSPEEIAIAITVLAATGRATPTTRAAVVALAEADKAAILAWRKGDPIHRKAYVALRVDGETVEATIDLGSGTVESWETVPGSQTPILSAEWATAQRLVKADPRWQGAMRQRGYNKFDDIFCESMSAGYFGRPEDDGRRLLKMPCYDVAGARVNIYARPIEGVIATVDLDAGSVLDVMDLGVTPVPGGTHDFGSDTPPPANPTAPANVRLDGRLIEWEGWSFHLGFDPRFGSVLSLLARQDGGARRMVLYQGHISEVFVPYMESDPAWSFRTALDGGEYGLGVLASPLVPGIDCPAEAAFFDEAVSAPTGLVILRERAVCVFERRAGTPLWRHYEALTGAYAGRPGRHLVVRMIPSVAHYDYLVDWVLSPTGEITVEIGTTGIDAVKGVHGNGWDANGALVAPGLVAIEHDHFFSVRLDLDIDGQINRFVREEIVTERLSAENPRRSLWRLQRTLLATEGALSARPGRELWRVENPGVAGQLDSHPGYQIETTGPGSLLEREDWPIRRAAFARADLWVTRYHPGERHAAGPFPNQSHGNDGLPAYAHGEPIEPADLVLWATVGFRHVTRPEDWPMLAMQTQAIRLRPYGFFARNPSASGP